MNPDYLIKEMRNTATLTLAPRPRNCPRHADMSDGKYFAATCKMALFNLH